MRHTDAIRIRWCWDNADLDNGIPTPDNEAFSLVETAGMPRTLIDLSIYLENDIISDPPGSQPKIEYIDHKQSVAGMASFFPGLDKEQLPDGEGWAVERIQLSTHNGTHLDAPYHFHSTMNKGEESMTIDEVPLDWCFQPGVKLDFRHFDDGYVVTPEDVEAELERISHELEAP